MGRGLAEGLSVSEWEPGLHPERQQEGSRGALWPRPRWCITTAHPRLALDLQAGRALRRRRLRQASPGPPTGPRPPPPAPSPGLARGGGRVSPALEEGAAGEASDRDGGRRAAPSLQASWWQLTPRAAQVDQPCKDPQAASCPCLLTYKMDSPGLPPLCAWPCGAGLTRRRPAVRELAVRSHTCPSLTTSLSQPAGLTCTRGMPADTGGGESPMTRARPM